MIRWLPSAEGVISFRACGLALLFVLLAPEDHCAQSNGYTFGGATVGTQPRSPITGRVGASGSGVELRFYARHQPLTRLGPPLDRLYAGRRFVLRATGHYADNVHENDARVELEFTPR